MKIPPSRYFLPSFASVTKDSKFESSARDSTDCASSIPKVTLINPPGLPDMKFSWFLLKMSWITIEVNQRAIREFRRETSTIIIAPFLTPALIIVIKRDCGSCMVLIGRIRLFLIGAISFGSESATPTTSSISFSSAPQPLSKNKSTSRFHWLWSNCISFWKNIISRFSGGMMMGRMKCGSNSLRLNFNLL